MRRKLEELLDVNLSYNEILDHLEEKTDEFTVDSGEVMFDDFYEAQLAAEILENHYSEVEADGLEILDSKDNSGFLVKFSGVFDNDIYDMPVDDIELEDEEV